MRRRTLAVLLASVVGAGCSRDAPDPAAGPPPEATLIPAAEADFAALLVRAAENGHPAQARRALEVLGPNPTGPRSALLAARALVAQEPPDLGGALERVAAARAAGADAMDASQVEGLVAYLRGDSEAALRLLPPTIDGGPFPGRACLAVGRLALESGDLERAALLAERAGAGLPGSAEPAFLLASIEAARGDIAAQRSALDRAVVIDPAHSGARTARALLLSRTSPSADATSVAETDRKVQELLARDRDLRLSAQDPAVVREARVDVATRLAVVEPDRSAWRVQRAELLLPARGQAAALREVRAIASGLTGPVNFGLAARLALRCGDCALATRLARQALDDPGLPACSVVGRALPRGALGTCLLRSGDAHGALSPLRAAVALTPWEGELRASLGEALRAAGLEDEAAGEIRLALRLEPASVRIQELAGLAAPAQPDVLGPPPLSDRELARLLVDAAEQGARHESARTLALLETVTPDDAEAELLRARALLAEAQADRGSARLALERAREKGGNRQEVAIGLGLIAFSFGERDEARKNLSASLTGSVRDVPALLRLGQLALEEGDLAAAVRHLEKAVALTSSAEAAFQLSRVHAAGSDPAAQLAALDEVLARDPEHLGARLARARLAARGDAPAEVGRHDTLVSSLLARDNDLAGRLASDLRAIDERQSIALRLAEAEPTVPSWRIRWANLLMEQRDGHRGARILQQASTLLVSRGDLGRAARIAYECQDFALAEEFGQRALQTPAQPPLADLAESDILGTVGACLLRRGLAGEARPLLEKAVSLVPYQHSLHSLLAMACARSGDPEAAIRACRIALQLEPEQVRVLTELGILLRGQGRPGAALEALDEACRLNPRASQSQAERGEALAELGRLAEAVDALRAAVAAAPADGALAYQLGLLLVRSERPAEAVPWLERAVAAGGSAPPGAPLLLEIARRGSSG